MDSLKLRLYPWDCHKQKIRKILSLTPRQILMKVKLKVCEKLRHFYRRYRDAFISSYARYSPCIGKPLFTHFKIPPLEVLRPQVQLISALTEEYLAHCFDLLGSGWLQVKHGRVCRGLEGYHYEMGTALEADPEGQWLKGRINRANLAEAKRIWRLMDKDYIPIDWHLDFKSGYRWSEWTWYREISYGHQPGVDVKVPWELSRMQHLLQFAWAYGLASTGTPEVKESQVDLRPPDIYLREFRSQILDFIANNPPRFGVNWNCTMDVAIRAANWLVAYDLFRTYGAKFDAAFEDFFLRSIYDHGRHIVENLEWDPELHGNHYLSDIVGLLFVSAYLPRSPEVDSWLALAVQELVNEVGNQFYPDGANFEASTSYHRLSSELVAYGTALVLGFTPERQEALRNFDHRLYKGIIKLKPAPLPLFRMAGTECFSPFPDWYIERLERMAEFTMHLTKPNGQIPQIGDNDNGRFLKAQPTYRKKTVATAKGHYLHLAGYYERPDTAPYLDEDHLDHRHLVAAINGMFGRPDLAAFTGDGWFEYHLIRNLAGPGFLPSYIKKGESIAAEGVRIGVDTDWLPLTLNRDSSEDQKAEWLIKVPGGNLNQGLTLFAYPDFGLYLFRSARLYLAMRCGPVGQNGNGGHAHNDQLSIELQVDGEDWIRDPGTYLYTPLPEQRNQFRSMLAHASPWINGREPGRLDLGLFRLADEGKSECLYYGLLGFIGKYQNHEGEIVRSLRITDQEIQIIDLARGRLKLTKVSNERFNTKLFSPGYGLLTRACLSF